MPTVDLAPNATEAFNSANYALIGGSTQHGVLADSSDSVQVRGRGGTTNPLANRVHFANLSIPAGAKIRAVRLLSRRRKGSATGVVTNRFEFGYLRGPFDVRRSQDTTSTSFQTFSAAWEGSRPGGGEWRVDDVNALRIGWKFFVQTTGAGVTGDLDGRLAWLRVRVDYNERPTCDPEILEADGSGVVTDTSRPTVALGYADPENDPKDAHRVRVHRSEGGSPGALVYDSGVVLTGSDTHKLGGALDNATSYIAIVEVRQSWGGHGEHWSTQQQVAFSLDLTTPAPPTVTVTPQPSQARVLVAVADPGGGGFEPAEWVAVQADYGAGFEPVRGGQGLPPTPFLWLPGTSGNYSSTPHHSSLNVTGDLDVRFSLFHETWRHDDPQQQLVGKAATLDNRTWEARLRFNGQVRFSGNIGDQFSSLSSDPLPAGPATRTLRVTRVAATGAIEWFVLDDGDWQSIGAGTSLAGTLNSSTGPLAVAAPFIIVPVRAHFYWFAVHDGINGPVVANPTFTVQPSGTTQFTDPQGRVWTIHQDGHDPARIIPPEILDHEVPFNRDVVYRARSFLADPDSGEGIAGDWATADPVEVEDRHWWLTDVHDPTRLHTRVKVHDHGRAWEGREEIHRPADMRVHVVESEPPLRVDDLSLWALDPAEHETLIEAVLTSARPLLYRNRRDYAFVRLVGGRTASQVGHDESRADDLRVRMVEIARPHVPSGG